MTRTELTASDADHDLEAYRQALETARNELVRLDAARTRLGQGFSPSDRVRRAMLCKSIDALTELAKTLPVH